MSKRGTTEADVRRQQFEAARRLIFGTDLIPGTNRERWTTAGLVPKSTDKFNRKSAQFTLGPFTFALSSYQNQILVFLVHGQDFNYIAAIKKNQLLLNSQHGDSISKRVKSIDFWSADMYDMHAPYTLGLGRRKWLLSYHQGRFFFNVGFYRDMNVSYGNPYMLPKKAILPHQKELLHAYSESHKNTKHVDIDFHMVYAGLDEPISILKLDHTAISEGVVEFPEKKLTCVFQKGTHGVMFMATGELNMHQIFTGDEQQDLCLFNYTDLEGVDVWDLFSESAMKTTIDAISWLMHVLTGPDPRNYSGPIRESDAPIKEESFPKPLKHFVLTKDSYGITHMTLSKEKIFFTEIAHFPIFKLRFFALDPKGFTVVQATTIRNTTMRFLQSTGDFPGALNRFLKGEGFDNQPYTLEEFQQAVDRITRFEQYEYLGSPMRPISASVCAQCGTAAAPEQCSLCHKSAYCGRDCQAAHWPLHQSECALVGGGAYDFTDKALAWIRQRPLNAWRPETKELGDRNMEDDDYLLLQRSRNIHGLGLTIQVLGIRERYRRQGHSMQLLKRIEEVARAHGLRYVLIQSVMGAEMEQLAHKAGYQRVDNGGADFIKLL